MSLVRLFIFAVLCYQNASSKRVLCDFDNTDCLTNASIRAYNEILSGERRGKPSSDPLYEELIIGDLPTVYYKLYDAKLSGLRNCLPELTKIDPKTLDYEYYLGCKHLILEGKYEINGTLGSMPVNSKGDVKAEAYDYLLIFKGEGESLVNDGQISIFIKNFQLDIEARGKVVYDFSDTEKSAELNKFANEHSKEVNKILRLPVMTKFMESFVKNVNVYLKSLPMDQIFTYDV
ncbi:uncharacterized protein LOC142975951 [Anticarsia gemmatalis]|uniref:uncharacterized protein LOC142975951 n=1 Tax=Anticarsia gemmatalis TaxID=129554 RepID=UPI003F75A32A